jgi:cadmium resistance protein CadD (predicted permease)
MIFFSSPNFLARNVVVGQYLGIGLLVAISTLGSLIALVVSSFIIGLLGLAPIAIGIKKLLELRAECKNQEVRSQEKLQENSKKLSSSYLSFLSVSAVTLANGADNIGVYTPLFAKYSSAFEVTILVSVFMAMTAVWCAIGYYFVKHPLVEKHMRRFGHVVLPFVLIGLGVYIMADAFLF